MPRKFSGAWSAGSSWKKYNDIKEGDTLEAYKIEEVRSYVVTSKIDPPFFVP